MDYTVHGILQARILEWVAFPFSKRSSQPRVQTQVSHNPGRLLTSWATSEAHKRLKVIVSKYFTDQTQHTSFPSFPNPVCLQEANVDENNQL